MDAFAIHICSVFMRKRGSRPSAKGRNRFFITAAAKRMRGVFFPMCKTRARSMAGLASRAFGGIRRFHVPLQRKVGGAKNVKNPCTLQKLSAMFVLPLSACTMQAPKKELRLFKAQKQYAPFFGAIPFGLSYFWFCALSKERHNRFMEELARRIGHHAVYLPVHRNRNAAAAALAHAERSLEIHFVMQAHFFNHLLKCLNHVIRAL